MIFRAIVLALLTINGAISQGLNNFGDVPGFGANNDGLGGSGQNLYQSPPRYYPIPPTSNQLSSNTYPSQPHSYSPPPDTPPNGFYPAASSGNLYTPPSSASLYPPPLNYNQKYPSSLLPQNPCPNYFQYSKNETNGAPIGIVFIKPFYTSQNYDLEVNMTVLDAVQQNVSILPYLYLAHEMLKSVLILALLSGIIFL